MGGGGGGRGRGEGEGGGRKKMILLIFNALSAFGLSKSRHLALPSPPCTPTLKIFGLLSKQLSQKGWGGGGGGGKGGEFCDRLF